VEGGGGGGGGGGGVWRRERGKRGRGKRGEETGDARASAPISQSPQVRQRVAKEGEAQPQVED